MTLSRTIPLLFLVSCGMKSVPIEALAEVSSASVVQLAVIQNEVDKAEQALEDHENRLAEVSRAAESSNTALGSATSDLERSKDNRGVAVSQGDVETARVLSEDVDAAESTVQRRSERAGQQSMMLDLMTQGAEVREAELDATVARLEMARAQAASDGGADLKLKKYSRQSEKYEKRLSRETSELRALEASHGTALEEFAAPATTCGCLPPSSQYLRTVAWERADVRCETLLNVLPPDVPLRCAGVWFVVPVAG